MRLTANHETESGRSVWLHEITWQTRTDRQAVPIVGRIDECVLVKMTNRLGRRRGCLDSGHEGCPSSVSTVPYSTYLGIHGRDCDPSHCFTWMEQALQEVQMILNPFFFCWDLAIFFLCDPLVKHRPATAWY
jgi:hypothetical protein